LKAFLLAAGHGTRLRPLTDSVPKCLVPVCGVPMLRIWLEICRKAGIHDVLVNLHSHTDIVRRAMGDTCAGVRIHLAEEPVLLGSAGTLAANRDWVGGETSFWVFYADVLTNVDLNKMQSLHRKLRPKATIGVCAVKDPRRCGIVSFDETLTVQEFVEKPAQPKSNWAFSGLMLAETTILDDIPAKFPADLGFDVLPNLAGQMKVHRIQEYLLDIGTMENYKAAQTTWRGL
jgi:mannose-1-phosphate guanylyltransferase